MPKNRGADGEETRSRRRIKPPGRKGMGRGNLPSRRGVREHCKLPQRGTYGAKPWPKTGFDAFGSKSNLDRANVFLRNFHWATLHSPSFPSFLPSSLYSPTFLFLPACPLPHTHSLAPFPFLPRSSPLKSC